jgi:hypothetical protein
MAVNIGRTHHQAAVQVLELVLAHAREELEQGKNIDKYFIMYLEGFLDAEKKLFENEVAMEAVSA